MTLELRYRQHRLQTLSPLIGVLLLILMSTGLCYAGQRDIVVEAIHARPSDLWPRGEGHVVYAIPGTTEEEKGYEEPGGSFSPAVGSFGISIWVLDDKGKILQSSDSIPMNQIHQKYVWNSKASLPAILINTPEYTAVWQIRQTGSYTLQLTPKQGSHLALAVRSVGPAGGPVDILEWEKTRLTINAKWTVDVPKSSSLRVLGHEGDPQWMTTTSSHPHWKGDDGWGYAVFNVNFKGSSNFRIAARTASPSSSASIAPAVSSIHATLPDPQFMDSLNSQVTNLMMGLVKDQVRPGEPTNYPLPWLRDGAYTIVALARAGQLDQAKRLALYFAKNDFFGGFGPEADSPGLSLWAISVVSELAHDPAFDRAVWPDVTRKANLIVTMRHAMQPIYREPVGPIVPSHLTEPDLNLVCEPARDGLIIGRMDWGRPLLFVNAVSFRGLEGAAAIADRMNKVDDAIHWRQNSFQLKQAWLNIFDTPEHNNERTYISTLWPTWVGSQVLPRYSELLDAQWNQSHDSDGNFRQRPVWTYFDIAQAHQWLFLGRPDRAWMTLDWFLRNQSAPDLYTWWEGNGEENNFGRWQQVRGWVHPPNVTPHYWTAAEILLLQMDMLAYADLSDEHPTIVVGAGVRPEWLKSTMSVRSVTTEAGVVDWSWRNGQLSVVVHKSRSAVRAGKVFGESVPLTVTYD